MMSTARQSLPRRRVSAMPLVSLEPGVVQEVKALRARVDAQVYQGRRVREEWLEIGPPVESAHEAELCPELAVVAGGDTYATLVTRLKDLEAHTSSPRFFLGVARQSRSRMPGAASLADHATFVFQWTGPANVTMLRLTMAYSSMFTELCDAMFADVIVHALKSHAEVTRKKLLARPRARARPAVTSEISNLTDDAGLSIHFISQNEQLLGAWDAIRNNHSSDAQTWMVMGYHRQPRGHDHDSDNDSTAAIDDSEDPSSAADAAAAAADAAPNEDDDDADADADADGARESDTARPLPTPILLSTGGGGLGAFGSGDILQSLAFRPGWLYWIYARVEVDSLEDPARFRTKSVAGLPGAAAAGNGTGTSGEDNVQVTALGKAHSRACKYVLIAYCCQTEAGHLLPSMSYRLMHHQAVMVKALSHHLYLEARGRAALSKDALVNRLLAHTDGNKIILTVTVGTGSSGTLRKIMNAATPSEQRSVRAPLLIRIDPRAPLRELKARIAAAYGWDAADVVVMRVQRRANREVMSSLISAKGTLRSEDDLRAAFRQASSEVAARQLDGDDAQLASLGVVSGEELYVQLVKAPPAGAGAGAGAAAPAQRASLRMARELSEVSLVERRRAAIEEFLSLREQQQKFRTPMFTSLRNIAAAADAEADEQLGADDDDETAPESAGARRARRSLLRGQQLARRGDGDWDDEEGFGDGREVLDDAHGDAEDDGASAASAATPARGARRATLRGTVGARAGRATLRTRKPSLAAHMAAQLKKGRNQLRKISSASRLGSGGGSSVLSGSTVLSARGPTTPEEESARVQRSDQLLGVLTAEATKLGARLVDEEDLVIMWNRPPLGNGKTARVREGILLCKMDQLPRRDMADRKSRIVSTRKSWARLRTNSVAIDAAAGNGTGTGGSGSGSGSDGDGERGARSGRGASADLMDGRGSGMTSSVGSRGSSPGDAHGLFHYVAIKVAVKMFTARYVTPSVFDQFQEEVSCLVGLNHPSIVQVLGVYIDTATRPAEADHPALMIMYELMPRGSLAQLRKTSEWAQLPFAMKLKMALDVARGIEFLHGRSPPVVHRDLKSDNLLVDLDFTLKIGDFGFSARVPAGGGGLTHADGRPPGTSGWVAPEVLADGGAGYGAACDIFSFGVVLWELVSPEGNPLAGVVGDAYVARLRAGERPKLPADCNKKYRRIVKDCWHTDPKKRPTAAQVVHRLHLLLASMF